MSPTFLSRLEQERQSEQFPEPWRMWTRWRMAGLLFLFAVAFAAAAHSTHAAAAVSAAVHVSATRALAFARRPFVGSAASVGEVVLAFGAGLGALRAVSRRAGATG